ncbi:MAG: Cof-type HAD-IIB family hydrolase [Actinomycetota bacterium]|nr:Cof-type HAD-IIB family hydrolase [Actinomycetota bacterium]MDQ3904778.1 Cof-type HAD-IIB family hydrolase [Actinomycetota bacterium]
MRRPRLVASDVDGTLLSPTDEISARTRAAVHRVVAAGVPFVLVTGRPPRWIPPIVEQLGHAGLAVCANGAVHYDAAIDRVKRSVTLDPLQLQDVADVVATALPDAKLAVELPAERARSNGADQFLAEPGYTHPWPGADSETAPRDLILGRPAIKLLIRQEHASSETMAAAVRDLLGAALHVTYSTGYGLIEVSAPGVTKGTGLARLAGELGIASADVLAIGDMPNDLPMLQWAGHGVAMANGHPTVLEAADEITAGNSEDGLALILERWF